MSDEIKVFTGSTHPQLARDICDNLGVPLGKSETIRFANENMLVKILENVRGADVFVVQPSHHPVSDGLVEMLIMLDALKHASANRITAVCPYFPYVRSDKKDKPRISITARLMADLIETAGADRVLTMDLHAAQIQGFFRVPVDHLTAANVLCDHLLGSGGTENSIIVSSDFGEVKDAGRFARRLKLLVAIIDKRREDDNDNAIATNLIGDVQGKKAILVDDEVASAGTLVSACHFLLDHGAASVEAAFVHPVLCGPAVERIAKCRLHRLVTTDSLPISPEKRAGLSGKLEVATVAPLLAKAIDAIHHSKSVSELFAHHH